MTRTAQTRALPVVGVLLLALSSAAALSTPARGDGGRPALGGSSPRCEPAPLRQRAGNRRRRARRASAVAAQGDALPAPPPAAAPPDGTAAARVATPPTDRAAPGTGSTAVILNMNARSVTPALISIAVALVGEEHVFVTKTKEDAVRAARTVVRGCESHGEQSESGTSHRQQKYSLVIPVGGDGTLSGWINTMVDEILLAEEEQAAVAKTEDGGATAAKNDTAAAALSVEDALRRVPLIGYIPMGTGNGLGYVIGCKAGVEAHDDAPRSPWSKLNTKRNKLERARRVLARLKDVGDAVQQAEEGQPPDTVDVATALAAQCSIVEMPLMEVTHPEYDADAHDGGKGDLCFFAGAGFDSLMLHDFQQLKAWSRSSALRAVPSFLKDSLSSVAGYCVALVTRTLPQALRHGTHRIQVEVTTTDAGALWVDHRRGDFAEPAVREGSAAAGERRKHPIYSGSTGIIAAATTPYYGGGMRLFPYARLFPGKLQLRLGRISPLTGFWNIPQIFSGSYRETSDRDFGCLDFVGDEFEVRVSSGRYEEYVRRQAEQERRGGKKRAWLRAWVARRRGRQDPAAGGEDGGAGRRRAAPPATAKGFPFQHSGESMGVRERFKLRVVQEPVKFVSFLAPRVVVDD